MIKGSTQQRDLFPFYLSQVVFGLLVNVKLASVYEHCGVCTRKKLELENTSENTKSLASISYGCSKLQNLIPILPVPLILPDRPPCIR